MSDWFHSLPVAWMALLVFGFTYFVIEIVFIEVKPGRSGRSAREKAVRKAVEETKVSGRCFSLGRCAHSPESLHRAW